MLQAYTPPQLVSKADRHETRSQHECEDSCARRSEKTCILKAHGRSRANTRKGQHAGPRCNNSNPWLHAPNQRYAKLLKTHSPERSWLRVRRIEQNGHAMFRLMPNIKTPRTDPSIIQNTLPLYTHLLFCLAHLVTHAFLGSSRFQGSTVARAWSCGAGWV